MPNWTKEQELAINKDNSNIIVSAGAGSGKTAVLTARVIRKLKDGININKLLVLTFTNEAAGEMKDRIREAIAKEESLKEQLDYIDSAYITTFDSFAFSILRKYHYVVNLPKSVSIIDSSIIDIKRNEIIDMVFDEFYEEDDSCFRKLITDFCTKDDTLIKKQILKIIKKLELKVDMEDFLDSYVDVYYSDSYANDLIQEFYLKLKSIVLEIKSIYDEVLLYEEENVRESYTSVLSNLFEASSYEEIKNSLNIKLPRIVQLKDEKEKIKKLIDSLKELTIYDDISSIKEIYYSTKDYAIAIIDIIKRFNILLTSYKNDNNSYEFIDIAKMAIKIVRDNESIREEIKSFYNEIMVDEYQDTNDLQETFISYIANNNVYMVGDIKQSIYRFRNANPLIFKNKYDNYEKGIDGFKIDLTKNFRSREEVLFDINKIFDKIMDDFLGGADYSKSHRMQFGNSLYTEENDIDISNYLEFYNYDSVSGFSKDEVEAFIIAQDIKKKIDSGFSVFDKKTSKLRKARYDDFCIIMDRGTSFDLYKRIFEYENIPLAIYKDEELTSSYDILIINNLIKFIIKIKRHEFDKELKYLFTSLSRSYLFEYSDEYIFSTFSNNSFKDTDLYKKAKEVSKYIDNTSCSYILNILLEEFNFYQKIVKSHGIFNIIVRVLYLQNICKSLEGLGYTIYDFSNYLEEMINSEFQIKYKLNNKQGGSVKIMNIHKSKGLEFPICYYSGLYKTFNLSDFNDRFMFDNTYGIITPYFKDGIGVLPTKSLARDIYIKEEISEKIRLLYVALTRAKEKMIFICPLNDDIYNNEDIVNDNTRLKYRSFLDIVNTIKDDFSDSINNIQDLSFCTKDYQKFKDLDIDIEKEEPVSVKKFEIDYKPISLNKFSKNSSLVSEQELLSMKKGTLIHSVFEMIDFKKPKFDVKYGDYVKAFLDNDLFKDIDSASIYKEYEFIYTEDDNSYHGIIDLMLVYDDHIDIVDYKLFNIDDSNYKKQLLGYKKYIEKKSKKLVNTYLYSIEKNELKKI